MLASAAAATAAAGADTSTNANDEAAAYSMGATAAMIRRLSFVTVPSFRYAALIETPTQSTHRSSASAVVNPAMPNERTLGMA